MAAKLSQRTPQQIGRYQVLSKLGGGGCGAVYKARDPRGGELVAIKVLKPQVAADGRLLQRFLQEFAATRTLDHPHIVRALEFGHAGTAPYLVMEFVDGQDLWQRVTVGGALPEAEAVAIIRQVAEGLHAAHEQGVIHRDVKPDNILLLSDGQAKLTDFGLVKDLDSQLNLTETCTVLGTPNFMAPEQFENPRSVDRRCDIYALSATLYMAVTGQIPFHCKGLLRTMQKKLNGELPSPRQFAPTLTERTEQAILSAMSVKPDGRPATCLAFVEALTGPVQKRTERAAAPPAHRPAGDDERRTATRFACRLESSCRPVGSDSRTRWKARVTDVSAQGLGLVLARRFEPGTVLITELQSKGPAAPRRLLVRVVRVQGHGPRNWLIGCRLPTRLSPHELQNLRTVADGSAVPYWRAASLA